MISLLALYAKRLRDFLPHSDLLEEDEWQVRHRVILGGYAASFIVATIVGFIQEDPIHALATVALIAVPVVVLRFVESRFLSSLLASFGLLLSAGVLVHFTHGLIESHFSFFVVLPLIALYADWRTFAFSVGYVAFSHGVVGVLDPLSMYNHAEAIAAPFKWGIVHAAYVLALSAVMLVHWNFSDRRRLELKAAMAELQATQTQLFEAQKLESIGSLAAGVAHEINTPIQYVGDNLHFIADAIVGIEKFVEGWSDVRPAILGQTQPEQTVKAMDDIIDSTDLDFLMAEIPGAVAQGIEGIARVSEIVKAMKAFSHPSDDVIPVDVNELISNTTIVARSEWKHVAELELDLEPGLPFAPLPPGSFNQVILNLVVNSAHAISDRADPAHAGLIKISTRGEKGHVVVKVVDNGGGLPEAIRNRVFDQFFTTKQIGRGTGQGLSIARSVVEGLGGQISFTTELGVGTTFTVEIPYSRELADANT